MKTLCCLSLIAVLVISFSCRKRPNDNLGKGIKVNAKITSLEGAAITSVNEGVKIKISANEFRALNQTQDQFLMKEGKIFFDEVEGEILDAQDDYIIGIVPIMNYYDIDRINIRLLLGNLYYDLCIRCLLYGPKVTGDPFVGITDSLPDGTFNMPAEMTIDAMGNLYLIDQRDLHDVIFRVTPDGSASVYAGASGDFGRLVGIGIDYTRNLLYVADATSQQIKAINMSAPSSPYVLAGNGTEGNTDGPGSTASFRFGTNSVAQDQAANEKGQGLAVDAAGNIFVGERYGTITGSSQIRRISPSGVVSTVSGSRIETTEGLDHARVPTGLTINASNEIVYTTGGIGDFHGLSKVVGSVSDIAGRFDREGMLDGTGTGAKFSYPKAVHYNSGYYYVADGSNGALRRVTLSGEVITLAGVGHMETPTYDGVGTVIPAVKKSYYMPVIAVVSNPQIEAAKAIKMDQVSGVVARSPNLIYVADYMYKCIWKISIN